MQTSTRRGILYPNLTRTGDVPDIPAHFKNLIDALDIDVEFLQGTLAARPAASRGGRLYFVNSGSGIGGWHLDDGTNWQEMARSAAVAEVPIGGMVDWPWASGSIPSWAVLPYGQLLTQASYASMQVIADAAGRPYGGSAGTNFNVPDMRGRVSAGKDDMGGATAGRITAAISGAAGTTLGAVCGNEGVALTTGQMPAHNHSASADTQGYHSHGGSTDGQGSHSHGGAVNAEGSDHTHSYYGERSGDNWGFTASGSPGFAANAAVAPGSSGVGWNGTSGGRSAAHVHGINTDGYHSHNISTDGQGSHSHNISVGNTGSGTTHLNTQPTIIVNKIMRVI